MDCFVTTFLAMTTMHRHCGRKMSLRAEGVAIHFESITTNSQDPHHTLYTHFDYECSQKAACGQPFEVE